METGRQRCLQEAPAAALARIACAAATFAGIAYAVLSCILITAIKFNVALHHIFGLFTLLFALFPSLVRKKQA